ncbi:MAG: glutamate racemase [Clostridia bacterium]|nr:glutamate racemase [Clostridia bacterium]
MTDSQKPIGVFDSGLGGLTVVKELLEKMPNENIIYFGDTARMPYGDRSKATILQYVWDDVHFLLKHDVKAICIACNTADSMAHAELSQTFSLPIIGVVEPAARQAVEESRNGKIGVIGTHATVRSRSYENAISAVDPGMQVFPVACPLLAPLVEEGRFRPGDPVVEEVLRGYFVPLVEQDVDTLILGCTHYPLLYDVIAKLLPGVKLICSGTASTRSLARTLSEKGLLNTSQEPRTVRFFVSDAPKRFVRYGGIFIGRSLEGMVEKVEL